MLLFKSLIWHHCFLYVFPALGECVTRSLGILNNYQATLTNTLSITKCKTLKAIHNSFKVATEKLRQQMFPHSLFSSFFRFGVRASCVNPVSVEASPPFLSSSHTPWPPSVFQHSGWIGKNLMMYRKHNNLAVFPVSYKAYSVLARQTVSVQVQSVNQSFRKPASQKSVCAVYKSKNKGLDSFSPFTALHGWPLLCCSSFESPSR